VVLTTRNGNYPQFVGIVDLYLHRIAAVQAGGRDIQLDGRRVHDPQSSENVDLVVLRKDGTVAQAEADPLGGFFAWKLYWHWSSHGSKAALTNSQLLKGIGAPDKQAFGQRDGSRNVPATANGFHRNIL